MNEQVLRPMGEVVVAGGWGVIQSIYPICLNHPCFGVQVSTAHVSYSLYLGGEPIHVGAVPSVTLTPPDFCSKVLCWRRVH